MKLLPFVCATTFGLSGVATAAVTVFATALSNGAGETRLLSFDPAAPQHFLSNVPLTGPEGPLYGVKGIDFRPATGELYALTAGADARVYKVNPFTGVATRVGTNEFPMFDPNDDYGFDFDPASDRIRIAGGGFGMNLLIHPDTGFLTSFGTPLPVNSFIGGIAYDRNDKNPATPTTLYGVSHIGELVRIGGLDGNPSPDTGTLNVVGLLGSSPLRLGTLSMDIAADGTAWFMHFESSPPPGTPVGSNLYSFDPSSGAKTFLASFSSDSYILTGIAAIPEPGTSVMLVLAGLGMGVRRRRPVA